MRKTHVAIILIGCTRRVKVPGIDVRIIGI